MTDAPEAPAWLHRVHELGSSDRLRGAWPSPEPGAREDDGRGQAIEEGDVARRQPHLPQLVVAANRGGGECQVDGLEVGEQGGDP